MVPTFLLLLWLQGGFSGPPVRNTYTRVQHLEGETLSVQCHYKNRKHRMDGKVWCRIRRNRCEPGFTRVWAQQPHYLLEDDAQAKVVTITMAALRRQDSGRYWCMRNSSQILYPLMGIQLEVSPAPTTERHVPLTRLPKVLQSAVVLTKDRASTSAMTLLTPGLLTLARPLPSTTPRTTGWTPVAGHSFPDTGPTTRAHRRHTESRRVTPSPNSAQGPSAGPTPISTTSGPPRTSSPTTTGTLLNKLPPIRRGPMAWEDTRWVLLVLLASASWAQDPALVFLERRAGETISVTCPYWTRDDRAKNKIWCKNLSENLCNPLVRSWFQERQSRFSILDGRPSGYFTVSMTGLRTADSGFYYCGIIRNQRVHIIRNFHLKVYQGENESHHICDNVSVQKEMSVGLDRQMGSKEDTGDICYASLIHLNHLGTEDTIYANTHPTWRCPPDPFLFVEYASVTGNKPPPPKPAVPEGNLGN
ncbi:trem-like transcript 2 protein [Echinops telfairi]|uniref:Trem-like transcript 2 protein n=1 Tax=Echinops telfairi TaxID=9371 RepID=A0AC55DG63_ECHTE|nr:trem-like transcript 2 protein [Echinops telfairi]